MLSLLNQVVVEEETSVNKILLEFFGRLAFAGSLLEANLAAAEAEEKLGLLK